MIFLALLGACTWQPPLDTGADAVLNSLSGTVSVTGVESPDTVFVLLYDAADPPPPEGTGAPINFTAASPGAFTGEGAGIQSADWTISAVPDGDYLVSALMDADGDFSPFYTSTAGATCGDVLGLHVADLTTGDPAVVSVAGGEWLDDVLVLVGTELTIERPAFGFSDPDVDTTSGELTDLVFGIEATGIDSAFIQIEGDPTQPCANYFLVEVVDADADGVPDPHTNPSLAEQGFYEIWPKVYAQHTEADGTTWASEAPIAAQWLDPAKYGAHGGFYLADGQIAAVGGYTPMFALPPTFIPAAYRYPAEGGEPELVTDPTQIPTGGWSITVVQISGQTWTVPNETAGEVASQAAGLTVQ